MKKGKRTIEKENIQLKEKEKSSFNSSFKITIKSKFDNQDIFTNESDLKKFKIGDYVIKGRLSSTIYEVTSIKRIKLTESDIAWFESHISNTRSYNIKPEIVEVYKKYKENGLFGLCKISVKPIYRSGKKVDKGRTTIISEPHDFTMYRPFNKLDIDQNLINNQYTESKYQRVINNYDKKLKTAKAHTNFLVSLKTELSNKKAENLWKTMDSTENQTL